MLLAVGVVGGCFSDLVESLFLRQAGGGGYSQQQARGSHGPADLRARLAVSLEAVYRGDSVRVGLNGKTFDVRVPKGIRPGQVIRLAGQGTRGGNLLLEIEYRSEEHTSELQSLMRNSYAVFCLKKKKKKINITESFTLYTT